MEELKTEPIKVIYKVFCNESYIYILNRKPHFLYTKIDKDTIIGEDEAMYQFYMRDEGPYKYMAFGGRHFHIPLTDGTVEECHGQWWDGFNDTVRKLFNTENLRYFTYSTVEELRKCYVYTGCYADVEWIRKLDMEYNGDVYDHWKFKEMIESNKEE